MAVQTQGGVQAQTLGKGLIYNTDSQARLTRGALEVSTSFYGVEIDYAPIWHWMEPATLSACEAQNVIDNPADLESAADTELEAVKCISEHSSEVMFRPDFASPRLAVVPELHQPQWPTGGKYVSFRSFVIVYIQSIYGNCTAGGCATIITPGELDQKNQPGNGTNEGTIEATTMIVLPNPTVPLLVRNRLLNPPIESYVLIR
jgi:hypothetical protein